MFSFPGLERNGRCCTGLEPVVGCGACGHHQPRFLDGIETVIRVLRLGQRAGNDIAADMEAPSASFGYRRKLILGKTTLWNDGSTLAPRVNHAAPTFTDERFILRCSAVVTSRNCVGNV